MPAIPIRIVEVGPRDGLQNEPLVFPVDTRVALINLLSQCGFAEIEVGSFVSPNWIPQMADTGLVYRQIMKSTACRYSALVPNERGMADALAAGVRDISIFTAASETFSQKNTNASIDETFRRFEPVMLMARQHGIRVRGYVSCAITCPYEGTIAPAAVANVAKRLFDLGCAEISLGDTIGQGTPESTAAMAEAVAESVPIEQLAIHCHDTYGNAVLNIMAALRLGIRTVDAAIQGLGGCPYAGGKAKGNVATETVIAALQKEGYTTGIDDKALKIAGEFVATHIKRM
jgi:hydroxymethylglutaryl-CoA lyase